ncbi:nicotinic acid mononucleotide adenyltransferase [Aggregatimonas sangjinii]|uniref:Nicotinic acid mononucleotide adenyltransferase n=1 Tax=Aggregatimonas sangjinii TaxID=2583587 RepID=A0A5B7SZ64_9FLAO|nr:nicotinic acid mononucleotide adenyltransferase [Aggregatimonas sangjinii]QCX02094.1 nicotinic acid mononucleotide adenyltransferase [Aggregatimonas sangjinii]
MKTIQLLLGFVLAGALLASCTTDVIIEDEFIEESAFNTAVVLESYDLWYVDINATRGNGEVPFLQRAFTISFNNGVVYANNNIVGIGKTGNGFGIDVGTFGTFNGAVEIDHDVDGLWLLDVFAVNANTLELRDPRSGTSYFINGYQTNNFDYDFVFYDNIDYFIQEFDAWEKTYTSQEGALNDFDDENFLQFLPTLFRSSIDAPGTSFNNLQWDFQGDYEVYDVENDETLKTLTLGYDGMGNDYFELYVINDSTAELYHPDSGTTYEFRGRGYQEYLKSGKSTVEKKRKKTSRPVMKVKRSKK